jgi:hypothetical protein
MELVRHPGKWVLRLNGAEASLLRESLAAVLEMYAVPPAEMDPKVSEVWYQSGAARKARMTPEETAEWAGHLHEVRTGRVPLLERWVAALTQATLPVDLEVARDEMETLLQTANDHRLRRAAEHGVGEGDLETDLADIKDDARRFALMEIHFLAWLIEVLLMELSGGASADG